MTVEDTKLVTGAVVGNDSCTVFRSPNRKPESRLHFVVTHRLLCNILSKARIDDLG